MSLKYNIVPKGTELVATAGQWGLFKSRITLKRAVTSGANLVNITHHNLLPSGTREKYITIETAQRKSGLSYDKLVELCEGGVLVAQKSKGKWMVSLRSLNAYMSR